jgi:putative membrane protein
MRRIILLAALPLALVGAGAQAQPNGKGTGASISPQTTDFISKAASTDAFELDAAKLAQKRSANADVKAFAGMMMSDHAMTTDKLMQVLKKDRLPTPKNPTPNPTQTKMLTDLGGAPKKDFDKAYAHSQVVAHQMAVMVMQDYADHGDNPDLKRLAKDTVPLIQRHLDMALKLEGQTGGPPKSLTRKQD